MATKNSEYKIDFKVKNKLGMNLTFKDFRRRYYWSGHGKYDTPAIGSIVATLASENKLATLVPSDFKILEVADKLSIELNQLEVEHFPKYVSLGKHAWYEQYLNNHSTVRPVGLSSGTSARFEQIIYYLASLTPEFQAYETAFQNWIAKRPGLLEIWNQQKPDEAVNLIGFAVATSEHSFRNDVENSRPRTLKIGTLVQLREKFTNHRNKDPFYWNQEHKASPRLGMISKFNESNAYGYGSRLLRIMWIATSEETTLMERDLKILSE